MVVRLLVFAPLFKGVIRREMHFYMLFEHKCVLAVCVHNHTIMIKIHPVFFFFNLIKSLPLSQIKQFSASCLCDVTQTQALPRLLIDSSVSAQTGLVSYLRPALSELLSVHHCFDAGADVDKNDS